MKITDSGVKEVLSDFSQNTTAHGFNHASRSISPLYKLIWYIITALVILGMTVTFYLTISDYLQYKKTTMTKIIPGKAVFPDITMCNNHAVARQVRQHYAHVKEILNFIKKIENNITLEKMYGQPYFAHMIRLLRNRKAVAANIGIKPLRYVYGYRFTDMVVHCEYYSHINGCNPDLFDTFFSGQHYNCYTLRGSRLQDKVAAQRGLSLILYSRGTHPWQTDYYRQHQENTEGMTILIHPQNTYPDISSGFDISPGTSTRVSLQMNTNTHLSEPYGHCSNGMDISSEEFISNFSVQTPYSCSIMCCMKYQYSECDCLSARELGLYPKSGMREHTEEGRFCATMSEIDPELVLSRIDCQITSGFEVDEEDICSHCIKPCTETWYFTEISRTKWPSTNTIKSFIENFITSDISKRETLYYKEYQKVLNKTIIDISGQLSSNQTLDFTDTPFVNDILDKGLLIKNFIDSNFYRLNIYFKNIDVYDIYEEPKQSLNSLWSSVGGVMGFWAGCSLITGLELLQLIGNIIRSIFGKLVVVKHVPVHVQPAL